MILILGGIHEASEIYHTLSGIGYDCQLTVATSLGQKTYASCHPVEIRFTAESMRQYMLDHHVTLVINATHPHAQEIGRVATQAVLDADLPLVRYMRARVDMPIHEQAKYFESVLEALSYLSAQNDIKVLATGVKHIGDFYQYFAKHQCWFRIMPSMYSFDTCQQWLVPMEQIIAIKTPVSPALTTALLREYGITHFFFKESGQGSAFENNLLGLQDTEAEGVIIRQQQEVGENIFSSISEMVQYIKKLSPLERDNY